MEQIKLISIFIILIPLLCVTVVCGDDNQFIPGGVSQHDLPATPEIRRLVKTIRPQMAVHFLGIPGASNAVTSFKPISYRSQLVNGVNYFVKVGARTPNKVIYYHLRIYKPFGGEPELVKVEGPKTRNDAIEFF